MRKRGATAASFHQLWEHILPHPSVISFRHYIATRKYHQGRGSKIGWAFVARALGDPHLPNAASWRELRAYLLAADADQNTIHGAGIVWRSYISHASEQRRSNAAGPFGPSHSSASNVPNGAPTVADRINLLKRDRQFQGSPELP